MYIYYIIIGSIIIKLLILPLTSFPFDFASYVYQVRQTLDFGIHPLFYWNKGFFLQGLFFFDHYVYDILRHIFGFYENINILHFVFKFPLFIFDLWTAYFVYKIIFLITKNQNRALLGFLLWVTNPMIFWSTSIEGKYAIVATFFVTWSVYLFMKKKYKISLIPLALSASIYYYAIILFPIWFIFYISQNKYKILSLKSISYISIFGVFVLVSFLNFVLCPHYLSSLFGSLLHHAQPDAPMDLNEIYISKYSLFNMPFYLVKHYLPTNLSAPAYFNVVSKVTLFGIIGIVVFHMILLFKVVRRKVVYSDFLFVKYVLMALLFFILFVGKFQAHYIAWILPLLIIIYASLGNNYLALLVVYIIISFLPILIVLGYLNLGIFFLDSIQWGTINLWFNATRLTGAALGGGVVVSLIYLFLRLLFLDRKNVMFNKYIWQIRFLVAINFLSILLFVIPIYGSYFFIFNNGSSQVLATNNGVLRFAFAEIKRKSIDYSDTKILFHKMFLDDIITNSFNVSWKPYVVRNGIARKTKNGLQLKVKNNGDVAQYNNGGSYSSMLIPIDYNSKYEIKVFIDKNLEENASYRTGIRFANEYKQIIGGSDIITTPEKNVDNGIDTLLFKPRSKKYKYMEIFFSLDASGNTDSDVLIKKIIGEQRNIVLKREHIFKGKNNVSLVKGEIFENGNIKKKFDVHVFLENVLRNDVKNIQLNNCMPKDIIDKLKGVEYIYDINCVKYDKDNNLSVEYLFFPEKEKINMFIVHKNIKRK